MIRRTAYGIVVMILILGLAAGFGWTWLRTSLPMIDGELQIDGLDHDVTIVRDRHGIPHIEAQTQKDIFFAMGFVHAQDRLWQLDLHRHIAYGRLSEILGADALSSDKFLRTLSTYQRAREAWAYLDDQTRSMLTAYADGINSYLELHRGALPPEFVILRHEPAPFEAVDAMAWLKMMAWDLGGNMQRELARLDLLGRLDVDRVMEFYPPYPGDAPIGLPDLQELYDGLSLPSESATARLDDNRGLGSNNWVIDGTRTDTGMPYLANDPHLGLDAPSLWYLVHLKLGDTNLVGASMPSLPFVVLGRNDTVAWGFTNTAPDVQDLYLERLTGADTYLTPDGEREFITRQEHITVRNGENVTITVRESRHGPIISDVMPDMRSTLPAETVLALRWTALDPDDTTIAIGSRLMDVADFGAFTELLEAYAVPQQNIVYADTDGNIGYFAPGRVPIRSPEQDARGQIPAPGWKAEYDWLGYLPYGELPKRYNPDSGVIVTANEKIVDADYPHYITSEWSPPNRGDRIRTLIDAEPRHSLGSMKRIQFDQVSTLARDVLPLLLAHIDRKAVDKRHHGILDALQSWDLDMSKDKAEPLIYAAWHRAIGRQLYSDELGDRFEERWAPKGQFLVNVLSANSEQSHWCDDITTEPREACDGVVTEAFGEAMAELEDRFGSDWRGWIWGDAHHVIQDHTPFSGIAALRGFFELRAPLGGGALTVNVARERYTGSEPYTTGAGPSYRAIYDLENLDRSLYVIPTGQSGNPLSDHYDDLFELWLDGEYRTIPTNLSPKDRAGELILRAGRTE